MTSLTRFKRRAIVAALGCLSMGLAVSCTPSSPDVATPGSSPAASSEAGGGSATLSGAGASFPAPL
ncbi:MAG TPA: hypothetical protein V6C65_00135, partial [Allocoleopsis sp.]